MSNTPRNYCLHRLHICACGKIWNDQKLCGRNHGEEGHETVQSVYYHSGYICSTVTNEAQVCAESAYITNDEGNRRLTDGPVAHGNHQQDTLTKIYKVAHTKCGCQEVISTHVWQLDTHPDFSHVNYFPRPTQGPGRLFDRRRNLGNLMSANRQPRPGPQTIRDIYTGNTNAVSTGDRIRPAISIVNIAYFESSQTTGRDHGYGNYEARVENKASGPSPGYRGGSLETTTTLKLMGACNNCVDDEFFPYYYRAELRKPSKDDVEAKFVSRAHDQRLEWAHPQSPVHLRVFTDSKTMDRLCRVVELRAQMNCGRGRGANEDRLLPTGQPGLQTFSSVNQPIFQNRAFFR